MNPAIMTDAERVALLEKQLMDYAWEVQRLLSLTTAFTSDPNSVSKQQLAEVYKEVKTLTELHLIPRPM